MKCNCAALIRQSGFSRVLDYQIDVKGSFIVVCFLLGNYPASGVYMLTFRNTLSVPSS